MKRIRGELSPRLRNGRHNCRRAGGSTFRSKTQTPHKRAKKEKKRKKGAQKKHENNTNGFTTASGLGDHYSEIRN